MTDELVDHHRRARDGFTAVVETVNGRWSSPSPCTEWDGRDVLEHVIGFHDELLLKPLGAKPERPKDDPKRRWAVTADALDGALADPAAVDQHGTVLPLLTTDTLVHTWDLAKAIGIDVALDAELCEIALERAIANQERLAASDMFSPSVPVSDAASVQDRLLGMLGRDPAWTPRSH